MSIEHAEHVLIHGQIFKWWEKEPYVRSGMSIQGAIEFRPASDEMKCHNCGEWFHNLGFHIRSHDENVAAYKLKHGLVVRTKLTSQETSAMFSEKIRAQGTREKRIAALRASTKTGVHQKRNDFESRNVKNKCNAQVLYTIRNFMIKFGREPVIRELKDMNLHPTQLKEWFDGKSLSEVY